MKVLTLFNQRLILGAMTGSPIVEVLRARVIDTDESLGELSRSTGIDKATLSRFKNEAGGVPGGKALDALALHFGMELRPIRHSPGRR